MKKILISIITTIYSIACFGQANFKVEINPNIEALSIYWTLATADTLDTKPTPSIYYSEVKDYFTKCNSNQALNWYRNLERWDGYDMASLGLFLTDTAPFSLKVKPKIKYIRSSSSKKFLSHFNNFYKDCKVNTFINNHKSVYEEISAKAFDTIQRSQILEDVENFFGYKPKDTLTIFIDILNNHGNNAFAADNIHFPNKRYIKLAYLSDSIQSAQSPVIFKPHLNVIAHEYTHTFVSDFIPENYKNLKKIKNVFTVTTNGEKLPTKSWENELDELIVRTCIAKILELRNGKEAGLKEIENQAKHFALAKDLYVLLDEYIENRDKYKTFEMFYPKIMIFFTEMPYKTSNH